MMILKVFEKINTFGSEKCPLLEQTPTTKIDKEDRSETKNIKFF